MMAVRRRRTAWLDRPSASSRAPCAAALAPPTNDADAPRRSSGRQGDRLGSVYNVMIDKYSGQVAYAVMSFGGFLGIRERYHPLPWRMLTYDTGLGGYVVDVTRERLESGPTHGRDKAPWSSNPDYGRDVYSQYGLPYGSGGV